jgi:L-threonylcarbamoyladenylate synthase
MPAPMLNAALQMLGDSALRLAVYSRTVSLPADARLQRRVMPDDADRAAHELFATLRELDALGLDLIWVEEPPAGSAWDGVRDRLARAAAA